MAWVSAEDRGQFLAGLSELARRLEVEDPDGDHEVSAGRLRDILAARTEQAVLVLDNATDPQLVRHFVPAMGATQVIITSTDQSFAAVWSLCPR